MSSNDSPQPPDPGRILVIRLGAMGDVIHALPAVAQLAKSFPQAEIDWIIEPQWACLLDGNPHVHRAIPFPLKAWRRQWSSPSSWKGLQTLVGDLRSRRYDLSVDLQGLIKSACLGRLSRPVRRVGFDRDNLRETQARWFYSATVQPSGVHVVDRNLSAVATLTSTQESDATEFPLPQGELSTDLPDGEFVLATPVAGWGSKQWPAARYAELAGLVRESLGMQLVLDGAPGDREYVTAIAAAAPERSATVHISTIPQLIGATRRAAAVVGVDSGPLHLAAALHKPGVAIFGPTDPARNGPYGGTLTVLRSPEADTTYRRHAETSDAMQSISAEQVAAELARSMDAKGN